MPMIRSFFQKPVALVTLLGGLGLAAGACSSDATVTDAGTDLDAAVSDSAVPATDAGSKVDSATPSDASVAPTFTNVYATVVLGTCSDCHVSTHSTGLDLSSKAAAYTSLVGKASGAGGTSTSCQGKVRVTPNDAKASLFWSKIDHSAGCGNTMPLAGSKLSAARVQLVADWINAGAKND